MEESVLKQVLQAPRLHVMVLDKEPRRAFEDAALAALVADGWTHFANFVMDMGPDVGERMVLVLQPPGPEPVLLVSLKKAIRPLKWVLGLIVVELLASIVVNLIVW